MATSYNWTNCGGGTGAANSPRTYCTVYIDVTDNGDNTITLDAYAKGTTVSTGGTYIHYIQYIGIDCGGTKYKIGDQTHQNSGKGALLGSKSQGAGSAGKVYVGSTTINKPITGTTIKMYGQNYINASPYTYSYSKSWSLGSSFFQPAFNGYSWVSLGQSQDAGTSSTTFDLTKTQIGYFWYAPPSNGKITIYSTGDYDTYGGWGTNMSTSSTETTGGSIVIGASYSNDDSGDGSNFKCVDIPVTKDTWGQVFVHGFKTAVSGTLFVVFTPDPYTISYNANGGSGTTASQTVTPGNSITLQSNGFTPPPSKKWTLTLNGNGGNNGSPTFKNNYFNKWRAGSTSGTAYAAGASYTPTTSTTMYAWWGTNYVWGSTTKSDTTADGFKVTFNANSGTCSTAHLTAIDTTKYEFLGWGSSADATTASWNSTSTIGQTSDYTAYAVWKPTTTKGSIKLPTPTRTNYTFKGWYTADSGGTKIGDAGASYTPTATTTLYAQWTLNQVKLTLTKGSNISSVTIDGTSTTSKNVTPGTSVTIAATPSSGYHFTNWTGYATITNNPYTFTIKEARSYTANAVANTYTVKYNGGTGATGSTASSSHTYGTAKTLTANGFSKFGHTFKGWATSLDRANAGKVDYTNQASVSNLTTTNGADVNLYAVWEKYTKVYIYTNKKDGTSKWVPVEKYTYTSG